MMMNDPSLGGGENAAIAAECDNKYNWYQCQGHKKAHCCANTCLNNPDKNAGKCALCKCHGKCAYRDDIATTWKERNGNAYAAVQWRRKRKKRKRKGSSLIGSSF